MKKIKLLMLAFAGTLSFGQTTNSLDSILQAAYQLDVLEERAHHRRLSEARAIAPDHAAHVPAAIAVSRNEDDLDDDGMDDDWEIEHGLNPGDAKDAWGDADGDQVLNLFEFQLGANPGDPATPPSINVLPGTDIAGIINSAAPGTLLRIPAGVFTVEHKWFGVLNPTSKKVMVQGGWNETFTERSLCTTVFEAVPDKEILYFSVDLDTTVVIVDRITFEGSTGFFGAVNFIADNDAFVRWSLINCIIRNTSSVTGALGMRFWGAGKGQGYIVNTLIANNETWSAIEAYSSGCGNGKIKLFNSTLSETDHYGIEGFTLDCASLDIGITNSIIWGNSSYAISYDGFGDTVQIGVRHSDIESVFTIAEVNYEELGGVIQANPLFENPSAGDFSLLPNSPCIQTGIDIGLPFTGNQPDMGASSCTQLTAYKDDFSFSNKRIAVYPNPVRIGTRLNVELPVAANSDFMIRWLDVNGRPLGQTTHHLFDGNFFTLTTPDYPGVYWLEALNKEGWKQIVKVIITSN